METFIKVQIVLFLLGVIGSAQNLHKGEYPRQVDKRTDSIGIVVSALLLLWAARVLP